MPTAQLHRSWEDVFDRPSKNVPGSGFLLSFPSEGFILRQGLLLSLEIVVKAPSGKRDLWLYLVDFRVEQVGQYLSMLSASCLVLLLTFQ